MRPRSVPHRAFRRAGPAAIRAAGICLLALGTAATGTNPREDPWLRVNTHHFIVFGQVDGAALVDVANRLEQFRGALEAASPELSDSAPRPAYAFVFADAEATDRYLPHAGRSDPRPGDGFFGRTDRDFLVIDLAAGPARHRAALHGYARSLGPAGAPAGAPAAAPDDDPAGFDRIFAAYLAAPGGTRAMSTVPVSRAESLARLGDLLAQIDPTRLAAAEEHLRAALEIDPSNITALLACARIDHRREHWDAAAARYEAAQDMGGAPAATQYGWMLLDRWDAEHSHARIEELTAPPPAALRARELFQRALALSADDPSALHGLGRTYLYGQAADPAAAAVLTRAHKLRPSRAEITLDLIRVLAAAGRVDEARTLADDALRRDPAAAGLVSEAERAIAAAQVNLAAEAAAARRPDEGRAILQSALERTTDPGARALLADHLSQFQASDAKRRLSATLNDAADAAARGDYESAYRLYELAAEMADDPQAKRNAAEMARSTRRQAAINRATARVAKAIARANEGDIAGAYADLNAVLRDEPGMPDALKLEATRARDRLQAALQRR